MNRLSANDAFRWVCPGCSTVNNITWEKCCACNTERTSIGIEAMSAAGFEWDPSATGYARWTHKVLGITCLRSPWMLQSDWEKHMASKIDEANQMSQRPSKPFLRENKMNPGYYEIVRTRGTLEEFYDVDAHNWSGAKSLLYLDKK